MCVLNGTRLGITSGGGVWYNYGMKMKLCRLCLAALAAVSVSHNGFYIKSGEVTLKATSAAFAPLALGLTTQR